MRQMKRIVAMMLAVMMVLTMDCTPVQAASVAGKSEDNAIILKAGKKKTTKFWKGEAASIYYVISTPEQGKLQVSISAEKLGTSVDVQIRKVNTLNWDQKTTFKYNKTKKITSGTLKVTDILPVGNYIIQVTPGKVINSEKKLTISTKFTASKYNDVEPNNTEETAQKINIYTSKTQKMYLTSMKYHENQDLTDTMVLYPKDVETIKITFSSKANVNGVKVLLRKKTDNGYETVQSFDASSGKISETVKVQKGTYYLKVWCADDSTPRQMPYTIKCEVI